MTSGIEPSQTGSNGKPWVWAKSGSLIALVLGILLWLWPIGPGGKMPIGGDVTQFSIGLMAELSRAIRSGRLPFWNDLWGYGFPGLAESQMGAFYPPHLVLYGLLPVEWAYTTCLVLHTLWAGLGVAWASRRFGISDRGGALAGFAWATGGFFLIHLPHQWAATTASWMPWAWGLAWSLTRGEAESRRRTALLLAAILTLQILPGHFQLAFITQVTTVLIGFCGLISRPASGQRAVSLILALVGVLPLSLAQLGPTAELAGLASSQRSVEYLSAFASPPSHLVSYVAPGLFQQSPLWRPLVWDAFHAMPEEHRAAIGLVPLFLAVIALKRWRNPVVRTLSVIALVATCLSLGPYLPGFSTYCRLPGFSFFRAPARWGSAATLALALLAGRGVDELPALLRAGRSLRRFVLIAASLPLMVLGLFELALFATEPVAGRPAHPDLSLILDRTFRATTPWPDVEPSLTSRMDEARRPLNDSRVMIALARQGRPFGLPADRTLALTRGSIYIQELGPTVVLLVALFLVSFIDQKPATFLTFLLVILAFEAAYWSRQRPFDLGPVRPLTEQSAVLNHLASLPRGTRSIDPSKNLSMISGVAPLLAYRTLDLPAMTELTNLAAYRYHAPAARAVGAGLRVIEPGELNRQPGDIIPLSGWELVAEVTDPTLLGWLTGADWVRSLGNRVPQTFAILRPVSEPARAWFVSTDLLEMPAAGDVRSVLTSLDSAKPLTLKSRRPEDVSIDFDASEPGTVIVAQLDYPRWRATLNGKPVPVTRAFDGWQGVEIPGVGHWTLRLAYDTTRDWACIAVSGLAWMAWGLLYWSAKPEAGKRAEGVGQ